MLFKIYLSESPNILSALKAKRLKYANVEYIVYHWIDVHIYTYIPVYMQYIIIHVLLCIYIYTWCDHVMQRKATAMALSTAVVLPFHLFSLKHKRLVQLYKKLKFKKKLIVKSFSLHFSKKDEHLLIGVQLPRLLSN